MKIRMIDADALELSLGVSDTDIEIKETLREAPSVTLEQEWISVKDRMPRNEEMVVCYTPCDGYMFVGFHRTYVSAHYDWSAWYIITAMRSTKKITKKVTHWMRLPKPPKEEKREVD